MTTFDGSTPDQPGAVSVAEPPQYPPQPINGASAPESEPPATSLLDQIAEQVENRDREYQEPWRKQIRGTKLRLVCIKDFDYATFDKWRKASTPKNKGMRRQTGEVDQFGLSSRAIIGTNVGIEVLKDGEWLPLTDGKGEEMDLSSKPLLDKFDALTPMVLLQRLFGRDADVIEAGVELLDAAGYGEEDDEDPTGEVARPPGVKQQKTT